MANFYISEIDELLAKLEKEFPNRPNSRIIEEDKYRIIYALRDQPNANIKEIIASGWDLTKWL